jgi:hypothetical protein
MAGIGESESNRGWYSAKLLMECRVLSPESLGENRVFEESIVLFRAGDFAAAWQGAEEMGLRKQCTSRNAYGQIIQWRLAKVLDVCPCLNEGSECSEVYCRMIHAPADWDAERVVSRYYPPAEGAAD